MSLLKHAHDIGLRDRSSVPCFCIRATGFFLYRHYTVKSLDCKGNLVIFLNIISCQTKIIFWGIIWHSICSVCCKSLPSKELRQTRRAALALSPCGQRVCGLFAYPSSSDSEHISSQSSASIPDIQTSRSAADRYGKAS